MRRAIGRVHVCRQKRRPCVRIRLPNTVSLFVQSVRLSHRFIPPTGAIGGLAPARQCGMRRRLDLPVEMGRDTIEHRGADCRALQCDVVLGTFGHVQGRVCPSFHPGTNHA